MHNVKIVGGLFVAILLTATMAGCGINEPEVNQPEYTTVPVERGDVVRTLYSPGELVLADTLTLSLPVESELLDLLVKPGQEVKKGDALATVDTTEWDKQMKTLERALVTAQRNLTAKESDVTEAERQVTALERKVTDGESDVTKAERQINAKEFAVRQAQLDVQIAENNLSQINDVKKAQDAVDRAELNLKMVKMVLMGEFGGGLTITDSQYWWQLKALAKEELAEAQKDLQDILNGSSIKISNDVELEVAKCQLQIEQSQRKLEDAQIAVEDAKSAMVDAQLAVEDAKYAVENAKIAVEDAKTAVEDAKEDVADAQKALDEAREDRELLDKAHKEAEAVQEALEQNKEDKDILSKADICAPRDGMVLDIKYREGDKVTEDSPIVVLADLSHMQLMTTVGQGDIASLKPGMSADITLDALPGTTLKGGVDYVVPQKSQTSQTVTYEVYLSLNEVAEGLFPGMTGGATILVAEKYNVLRIPRRLVKIAPDGSGRVEVLEGGQPVFREVVIGVRGDTHYEIMSGLSEGELVIQRGRF